MAIDLAVVDGPNLFNRVGAVLARALEKRLHPEIRPYLIEWFDLDRMLAWHLQGAPALGTSIVHSSRPLGRDPYRLDPGEARKFWRRQASLAGCRARLIEIAKDEQEVYEGDCSACGTHVDLRATREKGVDVAVATELFATADWSEAALVSTDTDLAPAVDALARLNRHVVCLGTSPAEPTALHVQAADFRDLDAGWFHADLAAYRLARPGGVFDGLAALLEGEKMKFAFQWMSDEELNFVRSPWRVELGISRPGRAHTDVVDMVRAVLDDSGLKGLLRTQERSEVTMVQAVPRGTLSDEGIRRRLTRGSAWAKSIRTRGVFELIYDR